MKYKIMYNLFGGTSKLEIASNEYFKKIYEILNNSNCEWFPCEGNLIAALRGSNFYDLPSMGRVLVDSDIDLVVLYRTKNQLSNLKIEIKKIFGETNWDYIVSGLGIFSVYPKDCNKLIKEDNEIICGYNSRWCAFRIDITCCLIDNDLVYIEDVIKENKGNTEFPFQKWGGKIPYKNFLVDENGKYRKGLLYGLDVNIPYKFMSLIGDWNNEEYKKSNIHLPLNKPCKLTKDNKWIQENSDYYGLNVIDENSIDFKYLENIWKDLAKKGYTTFANRNDPNV